MYPTQPNNQKQKVIAAFIVIATVVLVTVGVNVFNKKSQNASTAATTMPASTNGTSSQSGGASGSTNSSPSSPDTSSSSSFKDGTYSASGDYYVPHGYESIKVTLTVKNSVVTDSEIENSEGSPDSASFQRDFADEYKGYVVGKSLSSLHLSYVAGASDTTDGFNDAVQQIEKQAQA